jgi:flagellar hook-associated protein 2
MATVDPASNQGSKITTALKVGSGVDIQDLATSLSEAELSPKIEKAENKISDSETKISAIGVLSASIESITSALAALEDNSSITSFTAASSLSSSVEASPLGGAVGVPGSYTVQASQLATSTRIISNSFSSKTQALNGGASFSLSFNQGPSPGVDTSVAVTSPTPEGVVSAINDAKIGVSAVLINKSAAVTETALATFSPMVNGDSFTLAGVTVQATGSVSAEDVASAFASLASGGSPNTVTNLTFSGNFSSWTTGTLDGSKVRFTSTTAGGGVTDLAATDSGGTSSLVAVATTQGVADNWHISLSGKTGSQNQFSLSSSPDLGFSTGSNLLASAQNAIISVNGLDSIERASNTVTDVIPGVSLALVGTSSATVTVSEDLSKLRSSIDALVLSINDFNLILTEMESSTSEETEYSGALANDGSFANLLRKQVRSIIDKTSATASAGFSSFRDLGFSVKLNGDIEVDESRYVSAVSNNLSDIKVMLTGGSDGQSRYASGDKGLALASRISLLELVEKDGLIVNRSTVAAKNLESEKASLEALEQRMAEAYARYITQFAAMESIVQRSKSTGDYLEGQFTAMENMYSN